jgi:hypothetical protein
MWNGPEHDKTPQPTAFRETGQRQSRSLVWLTPVSSAPARCCSAQRRGKVHRDVHRLLVLAVVRCDRQKRRGQEEFERVTGLPSGELVLSGTRGNKPAPS